MGCKNTKVKIIPQGTRLSEVLSKPEYDNLFYSFLVETYCNETYEFYRAVLDFKEKPTKEKSDHIIENHISEDGEAPINFEYELDRQTLLEKYFDKYNAHSISHIFRDGKINAAFFDESFLEARNELVFSLTQYFSS